MISLCKLFLIFLKIGAILLGGGYVILPILYNEFCDKRNLVSRNEITDYFALSQSLPGIIASNISIFVGYKLRGILGGITAIAGVTFCPFWTIVILASVISRIANLPIVQSILWGISIAVIALILLTVREIWQKSDRNLFFYNIFLLCLIALLIFRLSPIKVIILFSFLGVLYKCIRRKNIDLS